MAAKAVIVVIALSVMALYIIVGIAVSMTRSHFGGGDSDDRYWFLGFYCNPNDPRVKVPYRTVAGRRVLNLGHPAGLALMVLALLLFLGIDVAFILSPRS